MRTPWTQEPEVTAHRTRTGEREARIGAGQRVPNEQPSRGMFRGRLPGERRLLHLLLMNEQDRGLTKMRERGRKGCSGRGRGSDAEAWKESAVFMDGEVVVQWGPHPDTQSRHSKT